MSALRSTFWTFPEPPENPTLSKHTKTFPASPRTGQDVTHTAWPKPISALHLWMKHKALAVQGRDPALGLLFVPAGTSINTAFKAAPLGCWPGKSSSRAIQGRRSFGWALLHDFFPTPISTAVLADLGLMAKPPLTSQHFNGQAWLSLPVSAAHTRYIKLF